MTRALGWAGGMVVGIAVWALGEPAARAQELCDGRVCPESFTCQSSTHECGPDDAPECEDWTETWCQSPPCETDADCPTGRRCRLTRYCDPPPPDDGSGNGIPPSDECVEVTESWCELSYELPCEGDAQCGTGFTCKPLEDCDCSDPEAPVPPDCPCEYTKIKGCYTPIVACTEATASTACPAGWSCIENENGLCNVIGDLHTGCNPGDPPRVCVPPGFEGAVLVSDAGGEDPPPAEDGGVPAGTLIDDTTARNGRGGGCSVRGAARSGAGAVLAALAIAFGLHRRRRRG